MKAKINLKNYWETSREGNIERSLDGKPVTYRLWRRSKRNITYAKSTADEFLKQAYFNYGAYSGFIAYVPICIKYDGDSVEFSFDKIEEGSWLKLKPLSEHLHKNAHGYPSTNNTYEQEEEMLAKLDEGRMEWRHVLYLMLMFLLAYGNRYPFAVMSGETYGFYDHFVCSAYSPVGCTDKKYKLYGKTYPLFREDESRQIRFLGIENFIADIWQRISIDHNEDEKDLWKLFLLLTRNGEEFSQTKYGAGFGGGSTDGPFSFNCYSWGLAYCSIELRPFLPLP